MSKNGLCDKCAKKIFTLLAKRCPECQKNEMNSRFKRCAVCAEKQNKCACCDGPLK